MSLTPPAPYAFLVVEKFNSKTRHDFVVSNVHWDEGKAVEEARRVIRPDGKPYHRTEVYKIEVPRKQGKAGYCRMILAFEKHPETGGANLVYEAKDYFRSLS